MVKLTGRIRAGALLGVFALILAACGAPTGGGASAPQATSAAATQAAAAATTAPATAPAKRIYYADARTYPSQPELLKSLPKGKFYIPIQDEGLLAVVDPEKPGYIVKLIKINATQPHHPWTAPGMRFIYVNHQSEGKGDHNIMTVIDTFTDEVVAEIKTDFDDPFHCSWNPVNSALLLCGDLNAKGGYVYWIDTEKHQQISKLKTTGTMARDVIQTQDGKFAFVGHQGKGDIDVIDIAEKKIVKTIPCDRCARLKMEPSGKWLFASSPPNDFTAIIDVQKQEIAKKVEFPAKSGPGNINFADAGKVAMIGLGTAGKIALVDVATQSLKVSLDSGKSVNTAYARPGDDPVAIVTNDGTDDWYTVINPVAGTLIGKIEAGGKAPHNVQWSADGRFAVGGDRLGDTVTIFKWNEATKKVEKVASVKAGFGANGVQWTPYFCGAPELTTASISKVKNVQAKNANGDCP